MSEVTRRRKWIAAIVVLLSLVVVPTASAGNKPYSVVISPGSVSSGTVTMTAKFTNETSHQRLGAANLVAPAQFTITSVVSLSVPPPATATLVTSCAASGVTGSCVQLRNLSLPPGASVTVTMTVNTSAATCGSPTAYTWGVQAKQANNFNGVGNDLDLDVSRSSLTTAVSCTAVALKFVTQPSNAVVGQPITGSAYNPTGPPISVETVDASGNLVRSSAPITMALGKNPGGATLGGTTTENAVNGVATFSNLTLNKPGNGYTLVASSPGLTSATSNAFNEDNTATICQQGASCSTTLSTSVSTFQVTANPGPAATLSESVDVGTALTCPNYKARDANWFEFVVSTSDRSKLITYTIDNTSPMGVQFCFGAPYEFEMPGDENAPPGTLPDGSPGFVGPLEHCESFPEPPEACVKSIVASGQNTLVTVRIDAGLEGDPWGRA